MNERQIKKLNAYLAYHGITKSEFIKQLGISKTMFYQILDGRIKGILIDSKSYNAKQKIKEIILLPLAS